MMFLKHILLLTMAMLLMIVPVTVAEVASTQSCSVTLTIPESYTIYFECTAGGYVRIDGKKYEGVFSIEVPTGSDFTAAIYANNTYSISGVTAASAVGVTLDGTAIKIAKVAADNTFVISFTTPNRLPGDVNADGVVDGRDSVRLNKYLAGIDVVISEVNSDVTGDGKIDGRDSVRLNRYLANMDVELL